MMDATFIEAIRDGSRSPVSMDVLGEYRVFAPAGWTEQHKILHPVTAMVVHTLSGFVDYCAKNRDGLTLADLVAHVKDPGHVELRAKLEAEDTKYRRHTYLVASTEMVGKCALGFGAYVDAETFYIGLQTGFEETPHRAELLTLVASIREGGVRETIDDGVSQEVKTGRSLVLKENTKVPNPVTLKPYRTFREVAQPASTFVLRMQSTEGEKPRAALFEADGGQWKLDAITGIAAYLRANLPPDLAVIA